MTHVDSDTLLVELLYEQEPALDEGQLLAEVNKVLPRTVLAGDDGQQTLLVSYSHLSDPARIDLSQTWAFRDGDTIEGMEPGEKWRCLQEEALIPPARLVIDLDPGEGYAAGQRFR